MADTADTVCCGHPARSELFLLYLLTVAGRDVNSVVITNREPYHEDDAETDGTYAVHVRDCGR